MIAKVVVENAAYSFDIAFSYQIPPAMQEDIRPGCRVLIPFGKSNRARQGLVMSLEEGEESKLKPIRMLLDLKPLLNEEQLWLTEYLHKRVFCTYYEAMRAVIPSGLTMKVKVMCSLGEQQAMPPEPSAAQQKILEYLKEQKKPVYIGQLLMDLGLTKNAPAEGIVQNRRGCFFGECQGKNSGQQDRDGAVKRWICRPSSIWENQNDAGQEKGNFSAGRISERFLKRGLLLRRYHPSDTG